MKKRIAIQLFGHMRTFEHTYQSFIRNVVRPQIENGYDIDIFIHTWDYTNVSNQPCGGRSDAATIKRTADVMNKIRAMYNPKDILVEPQIQKSDELIQHLAAKALDNADYYLPYNQLYNQYYTMYRVNELRREYSKKHNIKYDIILQTRPDILFYAPLNIDFITNRSEKLNKWQPAPETYGFISHEKSIYSVCSCTFPWCLYMNSGLMGCVDVCFWGRPELIDKYTGLFLDFDNQIKKGFFSHEHFLISYANDNGVQVQCIPYIENREFTICRVKPKKIHFKFLRRILACFIPSQKLRHKIRG